MEKFLLKTFLLIFYKKKIDRCANMESILKMIGITCLGEFTCDFCKDCGQEALGRQISMAARLTILGFSMPIVLAVLKNVSKLM